MQFWSAVQAAGQFYVVLEYSKGEAAKFQLHLPKSVSESAAFAEYRFDRVLGYHNKESADK